MERIDKAFDSVAAKGGEFVEGVLLNSAKVAIMAADHAKEIGQASKWIAGKLVR